LKKQIKLSLNLFQETRNEDNNKSNSQIEKNKQINSLPTDLKFSVGSIFITQATKRAIYLKIAIVYFEILTFLNLLRIIYLN